VKIRIFYNNNIVPTDFQAGEEMPSGDEPFGATVSPAVESEFPPGDSAIVDNTKLTIGRPFLKKILFPVSFVLVVLLLILQIYAAREIFFPKPHINSMMKRIVIAEVITHNLAENTTTLNHSFLIKPADRKTIIHITHCNLSTLCEKKCLDFFT